MTKGQFDLFGEAPGPERPASLDSSPEWQAHIRGKLLATLDLVRQASELPWPDLTQTMLAEIHFRSLVRHLPEDEAERLKDAFHAEMNRLYEVENARLGL